jgi:CBS domain containing-hemolysin-like protein
VHFRQLVEAVRSDPDVTVGAVAQPALVVPPSKDLGALLRELREGRQHLAVVADEYGGSAAS